MKGYALGLFEKLLAGADVHAPVVVRLSIEDVKDAVARDLESLLNTRSAFSQDQLKAFPETSQSIVTYGLNDFSGRSLTSADDRAFICRSLEVTITRHEPRLRNVRASLVIDSNSTNRLNIAISAMLLLNSEQELVKFDAVLKHSSLQYSISKARRIKRV